MIATPRVTIPFKGSLSPPFIVTRRGGVHAQGNVEVVVSPRIAGVQWSNTVGSTLWGMASGVAVVLDIVLGPAEIAPASCQPLQAAWSSLVYSLLYVARWRSVGPAGQGPAFTNGSGARGGPGPPGRSAGVHTRRSERHMEVPDPSRGEVRDSVRVC